MGSTDPTVAIGSEGSDSATPGPDARDKAADGAPAPAADGARAAAPPPEERPASRRGGLGLGTRIFLITSLLIALAVGSAVVFTYFISERIALQAAEEDLSANAQLQDTFREQRLDQLYLTASLFVNDPSLAAYVAEAIENADSDSILDLIASRQGDLGYDFAVVLDTGGTVLARTDRPGQVGADLSDRSLVRRALTDFQAWGVWRESDALYYAVAVPFVRGAQLLGYLVTAYSLTDATALEVKRMSGTEIAYLTLGEAPGVVATTQTPELEGGLVSALAERGDPLAELASASVPAAPRKLELELAEERWSALAVPLYDADDQAVGASVALTPLAPQLAPFRRVSRVLMLAGLLVLLAAIPLTLVFARRTMKPVRELVAATAAARAGDYDQEIPGARSGRGDELGTLATAFDDLLSDLREKSDMEAYLAELSRTMPEPAPAVQVVPEGAEKSEVALMLVELRAYANAGRGKEPKEALDDLSKELTRLARSVTSRGGKLLALAGHRVWLSFAGDGRSYRAFACGAELIQSYVDAGREAAAPVVALSSGEAVTGAVSWGEERRLTVMGRPVQRLESLAREASPGDVALSAEVESELRTTFDAAGYTVTEQRGVISTRPLYVVDARQASTMMQDRTLPTVAAEVTGMQPVVDTGATLSGISPGSVVGGRFEILSVLGAGGMGVVYKARDRELDEVVAVKMLKPEHAGDVVSAGRLREELRLARRITHPNVLRTFDLGEVGGLPFISMEYVRGVTLAQLMEHTGRLAFSAALSVAKQLCLGLDAAHQVGVLHRDIKPGNLILQANGNAKLMDFGIARPIQRAEPGQTVEGWLVGTPKYLAPEQLRGEEPDHRADIYATGVVFYEMFTGRSPFSGASYMDLATKTLNEEPPPPSEAWSGIPPLLEAMILRCLSKDAADRYDSAATLHRELSRLRT